MISERVDENGEEVEPRIPAHRDIRSFAKILSNEKAKTQFFSGKATVDQAVVIADPLPPEPWQETAKECLKVLREIKIDDIVEWKQPDTELLKQIVEQIDKIMKIANKLKVQ